MKVSRREMIRVLAASLLFPLSGCSITPSWIENLDGLTENEGRLKAGFGVTKLTPKLKPNTYAMAGFGPMFFCDKYATGIYDDLFSKSIVLDNDYKRIAIVSNDQLIITHDQRNAVLEKVNDLGLDDVLQAATHTHYGLGGTWDNELAEALVIGSYRKSSFDYVVCKTAESIRKACDTIAPAKIGGGNSKRYDLSVNRMGDDEIDPDIAVIKIEQEKSVRGIIANFAAHPVTLPPDDTKLSAGFPGALYKALGEKYPDATVLFLNGALAQLNARCPHKVNSTDIYERKRREADIIGQELAMTVDSIVKQIDTTPYARLNSVTMKYELPFVTLGFVPDMLLPLDLLLGGILDFIFFDDETYVQTVQLNDGLLVATPCDLDMNIGKYLKRKGKEQGFKQVIPISQCNGYTGYVMDRVSVALHPFSYEVGLMDFFDSRVGEDCKKHLPEIMKYFKTISSEELEKHFTARISTLEKICKVVRTIGEKNLSASRYF